MRIQWEADDVKAGRLICLILAKKKGNDSMIVKNSANEFSIASMRGDCGRFLPAADLARLMTEAGWVPDELASVLEKFQ